MIKTSRSRLEIRQEADKKSSLLGSLLVAVGATEALLAAAAATAEWALPSGSGYVGPAVRLVLSLAAAGLGWFLLRRRWRVVLDLDHRMVARYRGFALYGSGVNRSWDLAEFSHVVRFCAEGRGIFGLGPARRDAVRLRRRDGSELDIYVGADPQDADESASRIARFLELPLVADRG